jgi:hypothetical protein
MTGRTPNSAPSDACSRRAAAPEVVEIVDPVPVRPSGPRDRCRPPPSRTIAEVSATRCAAGPCGTAASSSRTVEAKLTVG